MNRVHLLGVTLGMASVAGAWADTLFAQPHAATGAVLHSSYWDPDGSDYDEYVWDAFQLPAAANVTGIDWFGGYGFLGGGGSINSFKIKIYASIPADTQPDLGYLYPGPLKSFTVQGNAVQTLAGTFGGQTIYSYHAAIPGGFQAAAGTKYWIQIEAWQPGMPTWGIAAGSGGNGTHFHRSAGMADAYYYTGSLDAAFSLTGTPITCNSPSVSSDPAPVTLCAAGLDASFSVTASGTGTLTYRWRLNGSPVYDGPNGGGHGGGAWIMGATTSVLTIQGVSSWADQGVYDCVVTNGCGNTPSAGAALVIDPSACGPVCDTIDFNGDALFPDTADIDDFLSVFSGGACSTGMCGDIDFNNDGLYPDTTDIDSLLSVFSGGACL